MITKKYKYSFQILLLSSDLQIKYSFVKSKHSHPYVSYMPNERWQGEELSKNHVLEMPRSHAKMRLKSAQQKPNFLTAKGIHKLYTKLLPQLSLHVSV